MAETMDADWEAERRKLERRAQFADLLAQQSMQSPQGQMAGRFYVPPSPMQGIAQFLSAYMASRANRKTDEGFADLAKRQGAEQDTEVARIQGIGRGAEGTPGDPRAALEAAMLSRRLALSAKTGLAKMYELDLSARPTSKLKSPDEEAQEIRIRAAGRQAPPEDRTLVEIYDPNSPTGTRMVPRAEAAGQPGRPGSGLSVTTNPDGTVSLVQGRGAGTQSGLGQATVNKVEGKIVDAEDMIARLGQVEKSFDPSLLTYTGDIERTWLRWKDKAGAASPADKTQLAKYATLRQEGLNNLSQYLNQLSGAAITVQEFERLQKAMPDPVNDSPTEFATKLKNVVADTKAAVTRYQEKLGKPAATTPTPLGEPLRQRAVGPDGKEVTFELQDGVWKQVQ